MTEAEWITCIDPRRMLEFMRGRASERKLRLFACACCRQGWARITVPRIKELVEIAERYADEPPSRKEWLAAFHSVDSSYFTSHIVWPDAWEAAVRVGGGWRHISGDLKPKRQLRHHVVTHVHCALLFDVFGNPFQPWFVVAAWQRWNDGPVMKIARTIYEERAFDRLPILADALEDADCDDTAILDHLRSPGPHVLGCWVVDLILGKL